MKLAIISLLLSVLATAAASVTLAWDSNSETNLIGYRLYSGTATRTYSRVDSVAAPITTVTLTNMVAGQRYFFAATAVVAGGLESDYSSEIAYLIPVTAPQSLRIVITLQGAQIIDGPWSDLWSTNQQVVLTVPATGYIRTKLDIAIDPQEP